MHPNNVISLAIYRERLKEISEIDLSTAIQALIQSLRLNTPCTVSTIVTISQKK